METFSIPYALLSMQSALVGIITPNLRAVIIDVFPKNKLLYIRFYYDGEISEELIDLWDCGMTETSAHLGPDCVVDDEIIRLDFPKEIPVRGEMAYLRMEEPFLSVLK